MLKWVLTIGWFLIWIGGFVGFQYGSNAKLEDIEVFGAPLTATLPGTAVRLEGTLPSLPVVVSPWSEKQGAAVLVEYAYLHSYTDSKGDGLFDHYPLGPILLGPAELPIRVGDETIILPLDRWTPHETSWNAVSSSVHDVPPSMRITPEDKAKAEKKLRGSAWGYQVQETVLEPGSTVYIVARLEATDPSAGPLRLEADPEIGRIEIYPGTQADLTAFLGSEARGLYWASFAFLFIAGVPLLLVMQHSWAHRNDRPWDDQQLV